MLTVLGLNDFQADVVICTKQAKNANRTWLQETLTKLSLTIY